MPPFLPTSLRFSHTHIASYILHVEYCMRLFNDNLLYLMSWPDTCHGFCCDRCFSSSRDDCWKGKQLSAHRCSRQICDDMPEVCSVCSEKCSNLSHVSDVLRGNWLNHTYWDHCMKWCTSSTTWGTHRGSGTLVGIALIYPLHVWDCVWHGSLQPKAHDWSRTRHWSLSDFAFPFLLRIFAEMPTISRI